MSAKQHNAAAKQRWGSGSRLDNPAKGVARITAAARACFAESGVASTTIEQIAAKAGVSRRTVYRYFDSREAIVLAVVEEQAEPFFAQLRESVPPVREQGLHAVLVHCVLFAVEQGPRMEGHQLLLGSANASATAGFYLNSRRMQEQFYQLLQDQFEQAQQTGEIDPSWRLEDLLNWMGRLVHSFIQYPEPGPVVERMVRQFLLPVGSA